MPGSKHGIPHPPPSGAPSPKGEGFGRPIPLPSPLGEGVTRSVTDEVCGQRPPAGAHSAPLQISRDALAFLQGRPYVAARKPSPPEGGRWHGEAVTDEGAYLNRNLYPGGSPKGLPYPGPQSPPCQRGARSGGGISFPHPSPRGSSLCGCVPALQSGERQKNPSAVEQFPPRRGCQRIKRISPPSNRKRGGHVVLQEVSSFILS